MPNLHPSSAPSEHSIAAIAPARQPGLPFIALSPASVLAQLLKNYLQQFSKRGALTHRTLFKYDKCLKIGAKQKWCFLLCEMKKSWKGFFSIILAPAVRYGEVSERLKEHAWKVCVRQKRTEGSNPSLSASPSPLPLPRGEG